MGLNPVLWSAIYDLVSSVLFFWVCLPFIYAQVCLPLLFLHWLFLLVCFHMDCVPWCVLACVGFTMLLFCKLTLSFSCCRFLWPTLFYLIMKRSVAIVGPRCSHSMMLPSISLVASACGTSTLACVGGLCLTYLFPLQAVDFSTTDYT